MPETVTRRLSADRRQGHGPVRIRRRWLGLVPASLASLGLVAMLWAGNGELIGMNATPQPGELRIEAAGWVLARFPLGPYRRGAGLNVRRLRDAVSRELPGSLTVRRGRARILYRADLRGTVRRAVRLGVAGGAVRVPLRPLSAEVRAPVIRQRFRNNCETGALQILLSTKGVRANQLGLQSELARSGPVDPQGTGPAKVWGDPDRGFVGRPDGGGTAGGFGVYPGPVARLARRHGVRLDDLSGASPETVYRQLRRGHAVMVWVGLSAGPYDEWRSQHGRRIRVNFGEHTVVLTGISRSGDLRLVNPLQGTREVWSPSRFQSMWRLLGRRALAA